MERNSITQPRCPTCSKEYTRRVSTAGTQEWILSVFYVYPFNCQLCGHRFRIFQWRTRYRRLRRDRREFHRLPTQLPVTFTAEGTESEGTVVDISMGGCTFESNTALAPGASLSLALYLSNDDDPVSVEVAVVRRARENQIGVEFLEVRPTERARLQLYVHDMWLGRQAPLLEGDWPINFDGGDEELQYIPTSVTSDDRPTAVGP